MSYQAEYNPSLTALAINHLTPSSRLVPCDKEFEKLVLFQAQLQS